MANDEALIDAIVLSLFLTRTRLRRKLHERVTAERSAHAADDQRRGSDLENLDELLRERPGKLAADRDACREQATSLLEQAAAAGHMPIAWYDPAFPKHLAGIEDAPALLWLRGDPAVLDRPAVAIVGSRRASHYAVAMAEQLAGGLSRHDVAVVSGLARGVDAAAHCGAITGPGSTVAVLGSGIDVPYPAENTALAERIAGEAGGAVVSEFPSRTPPLQHHFPARNRLISGMSRAVVIVEATMQSGSLITARHAAEQGRDVMAVPGNVLSGRSRGAHALIRDGAKIVETADDILGEAGLLPAAPDQTPATEPMEERSRWTTADPVLRQMDPGEPYTVDDLVEDSGMESIALLRRLTDLEIEGRVLRVAGGRFVRAPDGMLT